MTDGVSIRAIQEALGHKSLAMTVRYSHLSPDFMQDAVDKLAQVGALTIVRSVTYRSRARSSGG